MSAMGVLLVEDDDAEAALVVRAFRKARIANPLTRAEDGDAALDYLFARGAHAGVDLPVVVLLDLKLPRRSGFEVLELLRAHPRTRLTPVVVLTASQQPADIERAYTLGANSYLVKPTTAEALGEMIDTLKLYWIVFNQTAA